MNGRGMHILLPAVLSLIVTAGMLQAAASEKIQGFSADKVVFDEQGVETHRARIYRTPEMFRTDMHIRGDRDKVTVIFRNDKKLIWIYHQAKRIYVEGPLDTDTWEKVSGNTSGASEVIVLGREKVSGYHCIKRKRIRSVHMPGRTVRSEYIEWFSEKLDAVVRHTSGKGRSAVELQNIREGRPTMDYFRLPGGYRKVGNDLGQLMTAITATGDSHDSRAPSKPYTGFKHPVPSRGQALQKPGAEQPYGDRRYQP